MKELRAGVIGTGSIGKDHITRLMENINGITVTAVMDKYPQAARGIAEKYGLRIEPDMDALIQSSDVDVIVVTAASDVHEEAVLKGIQEGKPIFCEKPLAPSREACKRIIEAEMTGGKRLVQLGFMRRFDEGYKKMKAIIDSGKMGAPLLVKCAHRIPRMDNPEFSASMQITDGIIHELDLLHWLINDEYRTVRVIFPRQSKNKKGLQIDPQIAVLRTKQNIYLEIESYFNCRFAYDIRCEVVCEAGEVNLNDPLAVPVRYGGRCMTDLEMDWIQRFVSAYDAEFQAWVDGVKSGKPTGANAWDGYVAAVAADACIRSQETGEEVTVDLGETPGFYR